MELAFMEDSSDRPSPQSPETQTSAQVPAARFKLMDYQHFTHVSVAINPYEIELTFGRLRQRIDLKDNALVGSIEWVNTLSISPITAKVLYDALTILIDNYQKSFGNIPTDPATKMMQTVDQNKPEDADRSK
jgi:hypothetical protein